MISDLQINGSKSDFPYIFHPVSLSSNSILLHYHTTFLKTKTSTKALPSKQGPRFTGISAVFH